MSLLLRFIASRPIYIGVPRLKLGQGRHGLPVVARDLKSAKFDRKLFNEGVEGIQVVLNEFLCYFLG